MAQPAPAASLGSKLVALERILTRSAQPVAEIGSLADPAHLQDLFVLLLGTLVKRGPASSQQEGLAPGRLLSLAEQASRLGTLPLSAPHALRQCLHDLEEEVKAAGAWQQSAPLWWYPLPEPSPGEELWSRWRGQTDRPMALPTAAELAQPFDNQPGAPRRLPLPALLPRSLVRQLYDEAEAAYQQGRLALERGGVGASASTSPHRWDQIRFFSGTEPDLLAVAPTLAAFIQWCLQGSLADELGRALPGGLLFPPQKAMLARYPAPCGGYAAHFDNPGGPRDNGRALTLVLYLNPPERVCRGGELLVWPPEAAESAPPAEILPARGGSAILFDARAIAHQVNPLRPGSDRWALTLWFNDQPTEPLLRISLPRLTPTDVLLPIEDPPLPAGSLLFHEMAGEGASGQISVHEARPPWPRAGLVSTVYRGGPDLDAWCAHHFALGFAHVLLIFDHLDEPQEAADAARLRATYPPSRLTLWAGQQLLADEWPALPSGGDLAQLRGWARHGGASFAVAARQSLGASTALLAAKEGTLGPDPLDWLFHLDADEWFTLEDAARGGATLHEHLAAADGADLALIRYLNHELLLPHPAGAPPRFKVNPQLAAVRLGPRGWARLVELLSRSQSAPRPYFRAYFNGKSAVHVDAGARAAGVHGWSLADSASTARSTVLAGPSVFHFHFASAQAFRHKYLAMADAPPSEDARPFEPSPIEAAALDLIRASRSAGADPVTLAQRLDDLHHQVTHFSRTEIELLEAAGLILTPDLGHGHQIA